MNKIINILIIFSLFTFISCKSDNSNSIYDEKDQSNMNNIGILNSKADIEEIKKIDMEDLNKKFDYLKVKLKNNTQYFYKNNKDFFKYIIIGKWHNDPHGIITFHRNKSYTIVDEQNMITTGNWELTDTGLVLNNLKMRKALNIELFALTKWKDKNYYSFSVGFDDSHFILSIDTYFVKVQTEK